MAEATINDRRLSQTGFNAIKQFEGFSSRPYLDVAGVPTIGYGATYYQDTGRRVSLSDAPLSEPQAARLLELMVRRFADGINRYVQVPLSQPQFDALVSWAYNVGLEAARTSTLLRLLNQLNYTAAADQFPRWNKSGGRVRAGLTSRRAAERAMFLSGTSSA